MNENSLVLALRVIAAFMLISATAVAAYTVSARLCAQFPPMLRLCGGSLVGVGLATVGFFILSALRSFTLIGSLASAGVLLLVFVGRRSSRAAVAARVRGDARLLRRYLELHRKSPYRSWTVAFFILAAPFLLRTFVAPPLGWDTLTYHGVKAGLWVQRHGFAFLDGPGTWELYRNFAGGSEILMAWAMLPFHGDFLALTGEAVQWLLLGVGLMALGRELGIREPYGSVTAGFVLALPPARLLVGSGYADVLLAMLLAQSAAMTIRVLRHGRQAGTAAALGGLGMGLAVGVKFTVLPLAVVVGLALAVRLRRTPRALALPVALFLLTASPWWAISTWDTGRPLSPLPVSVLGVSLGTSNDAMRARMDFPVTPYVPRVELAALSRTFSLHTYSNEGLSIWALWPLLLLGPSLLFLGRRRPRETTFVIAWAILAIGSIYTRDLSPVRLLWAWTTSRFWLPVYVIAAPAAAAWCIAYPRLGHGYRVVLLATMLFHLLRLATFGQTVAELDGGVAVAAGIALIAIVLGVLRRHVTSHALPLGIAATLAVALLTLLAGYRDSQRYVIASHGSAIHAVPRQWVGLVIPVDDGPAHRIALTVGPAQASDRAFAYFFLGRRLQNDVRYVSPAPDRGLVDPRRVAEKGDVQTWIARLREEDIEFVAALPPLATELSWMVARSDVFKPEVVGKDFGLFRLRTE